MGVNDSEQEMKDTYVTLEQQRDGECQQHQQPQDGDSRPPSLMSRPLSQYSCQTTASNDNRATAASSQDQERAMSPVCAIV